MLMKVKFLDYEMQCLEKINYNYHISMSNSSFDF